MRKVHYIINLILQFILSIFPIDKSLIIIESEGDFSDNSYALYRYMREEGYLHKNHVVWLVNNIPKDVHWENTEFIIKNNYKINIRRCYLYARYHFFIYDHNNVLLRYYKKKGQKIVFLTHGAGCKGADIKIKDNSIDEFYTPGKFHYKPLADFAGTTVDKALDLGYPRLDYFFEKINDKQSKLRNKLKFQDYKKVILWMPTFRKSEQKKLSLEYFENQTGLPILDTEEKLEKFDLQLKELNALCVFKVHHLQAKLPAFQKVFHNILIMNDDDLKEEQVQLYQFIMLFDALITDYSSVSTDFLLLDRPILYTLDDYEQYEKTRGFSFENPKQIMAGPHLYNEDEFLIAIQELVNGIDRYEMKREEVRKMLFTYTDGHASDRILKHLEIER